MLQAWASVLWLWIRFLACSEGELKMSPLHWAVVETMTLGVPFSEESTVPHAERLSRGFYYSDFL